MSKFIKLFLLSLCLVMSATSQEAFYNINKYNGLSSNHVYCTLVDNIGYLWISTTDGVFRYNGYTFEKYDYEDGLHSVDIWGMHKDSQERIWLLSISDGIGYIRNNRYHDTYIEYTGESTDSFTTTNIYPDYFTCKGSSCFFLNKTTPVVGHSIIGIINNDTLKLHMFKNMAIEFQFGIVDTTIVLIKKNIYISDLQSIIDSGFIKTSEKTKIIELDDSDFEKMLMTGNYGAFSNRYLYRSKPLYNNIFFYDIGKHRAGEIKLNASENEKIIHAYPLRDSFYILSNHNIYIADKTLEVIDTYCYDSLYKNVNNINNNVTYFTTSSFWGSCLSTNNTGLYINMPGQSQFKKVELNLQDYKYINNGDDSSGYWWNVNSSRLISVNKGQITNSYKIPDQFIIKKIIKCNNNKNIVLTNNTMLSIENNTVSPFLKNTKELWFQDIQYSLGNEYQYPVHAFIDGISINEHKFWMIGSGWMGMAEMNIDTISSVVRIKNISPARYNGIVDNPYNNSVICYDRKRIDLYNMHTYEKSSIESRVLSSAGIYDIQKILADTFGNIIIKDYNKILLYNPLLNKLRPIFTNYNQKNSFIDIYKNHLKIAGDFGVLVCDIDPRGKLYNIKVYENTKHIFYNYLLDVQFDKDDVLLKTDTGVYYVSNGGKNIPNKYNSFKIVLDNDSNIQVVNNYDTISVRQTTSTVGIDVIKPSGTGSLNIEYSFDGGNLINSGDRLILPSNKPDQYLKVKVIISDGSWKSKSSYFYIYIEPYWWQTNTAQKITFFLFLLAFAGLIYTIIILTRKIVNQNNERRNRRRELELKSIYSQINPHFIFNSLSTAQFFVKKNRNKEAYEHINQFSDLLRSYIKSSRNKYITINDEIENLGNYLQLQLTRFENKFDYNINIDPSVNPHVVKIPSLLLQPIVENALNHGIFHSETKGLLNISFTTDKNNKDVLICIVDDNGIGRKRSKEIRGERIRKADSYGTILINELIDTFNKYENLNIEIEYIDKHEPDTGTTVIIKIENFKEA